MNPSAPLPARHLAVTGLACRRGEYRVFDNLGFGADPGEALLVRGPNGAGKTTLLMCLAGFVPPHQGTVTWEGRDPEALPGADLHVIGHRNAVRSGMTVGETLSFWSALNGGAARPVEEALTEAGLIHAVDLDAALLSQGQTRRLALTRLVVNPRPVWLLDEPTAALDADGEQWVARLIERHLDNGGLVVAATHLELNLKQKQRTKTLTLGGAN